MRPDRPLTILEKLDADEHANDEDAAERRRQVQHTLEI